MTAVFNVFAYERGHPDDRDIRRDRIPMWKIGNTVRWLSDQGFNTILLEQTDGQPSSTPIVTHHVCSDPACPGGC